MASPLLPRWIALPVLLGLAVSCSRPASSPPSSFPSAPPLQTPIAVRTQVAILDTELPDIQNATSTLPQADDSQTPAPAKPTDTQDLGPLSSPSGLDLPTEYPITPLLLEGPINTSQAEISGMDWYQDRLVLLPQYPEHFGHDGAGAVFVLDKSDIQAFLEGSLGGPLQPHPIPFVASGLAAMIPGYEGFEAIAFSDNRVYLTVEAYSDQMLGYLVAGFVGGDLDYLSLDAGSRVPIQPQTGIPNLSDESIVIFGSRLVTIYEANGVVVNPSPTAHLFDSSPRLLDQLSFPNIEYRLTDATRVDEFGRFWMPNTFFIGDIQLMPPEDPIVDEFGRGSTHNQSLIVERLLEFQFSEQGIVRSDSPPIQLELAEDDQTRNWEAIARLDNLGFLLATDEHPQTIFAFVAYSP